MLAGCPCQVSGAQAQQKTAWSAIILNRGSQKKLSPRNQYKCPSRQMKHMTYVQTDRHADGRKWVITVVTRRKPLTHNISLKMRPTTKQELRKWFELNSLALSPPSIPSIHRFRGRRARVEGKEEPHQSVRMEWNRRGKGRTISICT